MRCRTWAIFTAMFLLIPIAAKAQQSTAPTTLPAQDSEGAKDVEISKLDTEELPLSAVLSVLQKQVGPFNCVIIRPPGAPDPVLPAMHLQNITLAQFMEFIKRVIPGTAVTTINGHLSPIYVIQLTKPEQPAASASLGDRHIVPDDVLEVSVNDLNGPGTGEAQKIVSVTEAGTINLQLIPPVQAEGLTTSQLEKAIGQAYTDAKILRNPRIRVVLDKASKPGIALYPLYGLVKSRVGGDMNDPKAVDEAMNDILSLIKASLDRAGGPPVKMEVDKRTQALIFSGTPEQQEIVKNVLEALKADSATAKP
jgi:hypothetical protein